MIVYQGDCSLPPLEYETCAFWIDLPLHVKRALEAEGLCPFSSMHAANHALLAVAPLYAQCDATDIATEHAINRSALLQPFRLMVGLCTCLFCLVSVWSLSRDVFPADV